MAHWLDQGFDRVEEHGSPTVLIASANRDTRLFFPDAVHSPALSRDGKTLRFVRGSEPFQFGPAELYMKVLPDGSPVALTHDGTTKIAPALSPDGSQAVYTTFSGMGWASVSVPIGGGPPALLMQNAAALTWAAANRVSDDAAAALVAG